MEKIAFLFPGQGSQYTGMGRTLYDNFSIARQTFQEAGQILGMDLAELCFSGSITELTQPMYMQPALLTASVAAYRVFIQEIGVMPDFCAGHSLGEYAALTCAGAIRFDDAVRLVQERGRLAGQFADEGGGAMTIIDHVPVEQLERWCRQWPDSGAEVSCYNAVSQTAVSGSAEGVYAVEGMALENGGTVTPLMMSAPYHCKRMEPVAEQLSRMLSGIRYSDFRTPVIANVTAKPYPGKESIGEMLSRQLTRPVQWLATLRYLKRMGVTMTVELGPKNVLTALVNQELPKVKTYSFDQLADRQELLDMFQDKPAYTKHRLTLLNRMLAAAVSTPNSNWNNDQYRTGAIEPYTRLEQLAEQSEKEGIPASIEEIKTAFGLLKQILQTKGLTEREQSDIVIRILEETGNPYLFSDEAAV